MSPEQKDDLQIRILELLDGTLGKEGSVRLDAELRGCPEGRQLFHQLAALHSALEEQAVSNADIGRVPVIPIKLLLARQRQSLVKNSVLAAAAMLLISFIALWMKMAPDYPETFAEFQVTPDSAFSLTHISEVDDAPVGNALAKGSRLRLSRGTLEGIFESGARFVIEAPCDLTVLADDRISLAEGVAWFDVPPEAVGFTVETKQITVVDLGTKFGIVAPLGGGHEVHVTKGSVEVASKAQDMAEAKFVLKAGQARRLDLSLGFQEIAFQSERFTTTLPKRIAIRNPSFEDDENLSPEGHFTEGKSGSFPAETLTAWRSRDPSAEMPEVGWKDIPQRQLHPFPPDRGRKSQALSLKSGVTVLNTTGTPWASLTVGDTLTLTISMGMRNTPFLNWNEGTFFGLTDGNADLRSIELSGNTVANSGLVANNPATGTQEGDGRFKDVSFSHTVLDSDLARPGNIGILIHSAGSGGAEPPYNQSFFDNVRLQRNPTGAD